MMPEGTRKYNVFNELIAFFGMPYERRERILLNKLRIGQSLDSVLSAQEKSGKPLSI